MEKSAVLFGMFYGQKKSFIGLGVPIGIRSNYHKLGCQSRPELGNKFVGLCPTVKTEEKLRRAFKCFGVAQ
jgi:hypothetical protein